MLTFTVNINHLFSLAMTPFNNGDQNTFMVQTYLLFLIITFKVWLVISFEFASIPWKLGFPC
jgi:hypothetical protein